MITKSDAAVGAFLLALITTMIYIIDKTPKKTRSNCERAYYLSGYDRLHFQNYHALKAYCDNTPEWKRHAPPRVQKISNLIDARTR